MVALVDESAASATMAAVKLEILVLVMFVNPLFSELPQPPRASVVQRNSVNRCFLDNRNQKYQLQSTSGDATAK
jgi:hypothetical protein